jgi:hypothetical protein
MRSQEVLMQRSRMATASLAATAALAGGSAGCLSLPVWGNLFSLLLATLLFVGTLNLSRPTR